MSEDGYVLDHPRPIAAEAPYTYFLPSPEILAALAPGDLVKLIFRPIPPREKWGAERMWVIITEADGERLVGSLDNEPDDVPSLKPGDPVEFARHHVIDFDWAEGRAEPPPSSPTCRTFWDRCLVDRCVLEDGARIHFVYRGESNLTEDGDEYADSGWRIRGDYRGLDQEEIDARTCDYVALGAVLNRDDSWLNLIDSPIGSAFIRDWETGDFVPLDE